VLQRFDGVERPQGFGVRDEAGVQRVEDVAEPAAGRDYER
jgi:hypothetical protein